MSTLDRVKVPVSIKKRVTVDHYENSVTVYIDRYYTHSFEGPTRVKDAQAALHMMVVMANNDKICEHEQALIRRNELMLHARVYGKNRLWAVN